MCAAVIAASPVAETRSGKELRERLQHTGGITTFWDGWRKGGTGGPWGLKNCPDAETGYVAQSMWVYSNCVGLALDARLKRGCNTQVVFGV